MPRRITSATLDQASAGVSQPLYFLQIDWSDASVSRLCTHSARAWNGQSWTAAPIAITFDRLNRPTAITLTDFDATYRATILASGLSDCRVRLWQGYVDALAAADPMQICDGYADGCEVGGGKVTFGVEYVVTPRQFSPRERIGPRIGVNFLGTIGETVRWGGTVITLDPRILQQ